MSECVVRMDMPTKDKACGMVFDFDGIWYCPVEKRICHQPDYREIPSWCPILCQLPEGHGRLVDADALFDKVYEFYGRDNEDNENWMMGMINDAPTIVPAEECPEDEYPAYMSQWLGKAISVGRSET